MPRASRVCPEPGCPQLTRGGRCDAHRSARERRRGTRQQRGYGSDHDRLRAGWQSRLDDGEVVHCWRPDCGRRIDPRAWHLGHDDHDRTIYRGPECPACNLSHGRRTSRSQ